MSIQHDQIVAELEQRIESELGAARARLVSDCQAAGLPADDRIATISLCRAFDYEFIPQFLGFRTLGAANTSERLGHGIGLALRAFSTANLDAAGIALIPTNQLVHSGAHAMLRTCSCVSQIQQLIHGYRSGLFEIRQPDPGSYWFFPAAAASGVESIEAADFAWVSQTMRHQRELELRSTLQQLRPRAERDMRDCVRVWGHHFIEYHSTPAIDRYYQHLGLVHCGSMHGHDAFPDEALIGGLPFGLYKRALTKIAEKGLKHMAFCDTLLQLKRGLDPRNLVTEVNHVARRAGHLADILNCDRAAAAQILRMLTRDSDYSTSTEHHPDEPVPVFVPVGKDHTAMIAAAAVTSPLFYLLRRLRHEFEKDWDKWVDAREQTFRSYIYSVFPPGVRTVGRGIGIRLLGKEVTDIDAAAFDPRSGVLGLFQLKWQDLFGGSMRERRSRNRNLVGKANEWIGKVNEWIAIDPPSSAQRLAHEFSQTVVTEVVLFVVGRNFVRFSDGETPMKEAAWGTWPQIQRLTLCDPLNRNPIEELDRRLRADGAANRAKASARAGRQIIELANGQVTVVSRDVADCDSVGV